MRPNLWQTLRARGKAIIGLAPMDGVSDFPFREISKKYGQMDLVFSEFANVEGICHSRNPYILSHFDFSPLQRPFVAQTFGKTPDYYRQAAILLCELGVDGIDINMGCPAKTVAANGSGAALINTPQLAQQVILAVQQGIAQWQGGATLADCPNIYPAMQKALYQKRQDFAVEAAKPRPVPVSVKTRIGVQGETACTWIPYLLEMGIDALTVHGRTLKQSYSGFADWEVIAKVAELVRRQSPKTVVLGNGDVQNYEQALERVKQTGVDGVLIGRASFGQPFIFLPKAVRQQALAKHNIFAVALEHARLFEATYMQGSEPSLFFPMRKHLAWYTKGVPQAAIIRSELVRSHNADQVEATLRKFELL